MQVSVPTNRACCANKNRGAYERLLIIPVDESAQNKALATANIKASQVMESIKMPSQDTQIAMIEGIDFCHGDVQDMPCENKVQAGILAKKLLND